MGKLIKNHWARLLILTAAFYQTLASIYAFFWPKFFFDFLTTNLDGCVKPIPILQLINLFLGLLGLAWEWPLPLFTKAAKASSGASNKRGGSVATAGRGHHGRVGIKHGSQSTVGKEETQREGASALQVVLAGMHRSIEARLMVYPLSSLAALLLYQATNAGLYYIIGMVVYFWAFSEGEIVMGTPWTLPRRGRATVLRGKV
ncbi:uncharacterized protein KY384_001455 [Bacidia gigantensis]|uniref:uncharacterized protein n=1 Tax=Bacidia gigantensis TaxID=2732470 RepID=UPI001D047725|nr:uncharacterized protein KY384_001455 [Bacidia gigantensis]KAG8533714.1 hypothetical protein KY384_001455 [Bacidia gigantensis]